MGHSRLCGKTHVTDPYQNQLGHRTNLYPKRKIIEKVTKT